MASEGTRVDFPRQVARSNDAIRAWRTANMSTVQLAGQLLSDPTTQSLTRMMERFVRPIRNWYADQNVRLRSTHAMREWLVQQVAGGLLWVPLQQTLALLSDRGALEYVKLEAPRKTVITKKTQKWHQYASRCTSRRPRRA